MPQRHLKILVSALALAALAWYVDPLRLLDQLSLATWARLLPVVALYEVTLLLLWALGLRALLSPVALLSLSQLYLLGMAQQVLTLVVPGRLGDVSSLVVLKRHMSASQALAGFVLDKLLSLAPILLLSVLAVLVLLDEPARSRTLLAGALGALAIAVAWRFTRLADRVAQGGGNVARLLAVLSESRATLGGLLYSPGAGINLACTALRTLLAAVMFAFILQLLEVEVSFGIILLVQAIAQLFALLPIAYMGIGIIEGLNIYFLQQYDVAPSVALAATLYYRAAQVSLYLLAAAWVVPRRERLLNSEQ